MGLVLPSQMVEQDSYGPSLLAACSLGGELVNISDVGEGAFPGVTQSCLLLSVKKILGTAQQWVKPRFTATSKSSNSNHRLYDLLEQLEGVSKFPKSAFSDPGIHTGNISKKVIIAQEALGSIGTESEFLKARPVREGRQIFPYLLSPPVKAVLTGYKPGPDEYWTCREERRYTGEPILIRQTASHPIAAIHISPCHFRNSVLACNGVAGIPDKALVCILNSSLIAFFHRSSIAESGQKAFPQVKIKHLRNLPLPSEEIMGSDIGLSVLTQLEMVHDIAAQEALSSAGLTNSTCRRIDELVLALYGLDPAIAAEISSALEQLNN